MNPDAAVIVLLVACAALLSVWFLIPLAAFVAFLVLDDMIMWSQFGRKL